MAELMPEISRTFDEFLLIPRLTKKTHVTNAVDLASPLLKFSRGEKPAITLNIPIASAIMQSVSNHTLAIALARQGGISFIYGSQSIANQAEMVKKVKKFKAGFVVSDANVTPENTLQDVVELSRKTGHTTMPVTADGGPSGKLLGILTSRDYRLDRHPLATSVRELMTPLEKTFFGREGITLDQANDLIWEHKLNCLPIVDEKGHLRYLVFRKDHDDHQKNRLELVDEQKRLIVGAGINTRDYQERVPALIGAGADVLCVDSSDGYSEWQGETISSIKKNYGEQVKIGGGNVVDADGFHYLVEHGADFVKVGIGGGSICITREQKGIGRGQATALLDVARARDNYQERTGIYLPICSDGSIVNDYHIALALAMGADFVMMGRYFARFDESPTRKLMLGGKFVKEYWGEGSNRARNWQRYSDSGENKLAFEEGVDAYVPYAGKLKDNLHATLHKVKSTMINCGVASLAELQKNAKITLVSSTSIREGGTHDVMTKESDFINPSI